MLHYNSIKILKTILLLVLLYVNIAYALNSKHSFIIKKYDSLNIYFNKLGLSSKLLVLLLAADEKNKVLNKLLPGNSLEITLKNQNFKSLSYAINKNETIIISLNKNGFYTFIKTKDKAHNFKKSIITITKNIIYDGKKANISEEVINTIVDIFSWKIDFNKDLQNKENFIIVSEEGHPIAFIYLGNKNQTAVFAYTDANNNVYYYDKNGKSLQQSFTKIPLTYDRISSKFQQKRFHPILKIYTPHRAVDFTAKTGTPVYAIADGTVNYSKIEHPFGNVVSIKHVNNYETLYAHLSEFAKGIKASKKVKKGQVIGYVGSTGRSTGPHLHYELIHNDKRENPLEYELPTQKSVASADLAAFKNKVGNIMYYLADTIN